MQNQGQYARPVFFRTASPSQILVKMAFAPFRSTYRVSIDLNEGVERAERKDEHECAKEGLGNLLRWILVNR